MIDTTYCQMATAIFFAIIFFSDLIKKQLPTVRTACFQLSLCFLVLHYVFSVDAVLSAKFGEYTPINSVIQSVYMLTEMLCLISIHCYVLSLSYRLKLKISVMTVLGGLFSLLLTVGILLSPWTKWFYEMKKNGDIMRTDAYIAVLIFIGITLLIDVISMWYFCRNQTLKKRIMITFLVIAFLISIVNKIISRWQLDFVFGGMVFVMYAFYLSLQSPDFFVDNETLAFNRNGLFRVLKERVAYEKETSCLIIRIRYYHAMNQIYGGNTLRELRKKIAKILVEKCGEANVYRIGTSSFAITTNSQEDTRKLYDSIKGKILESWNIENKIVNVEYSYYEITYPDDGENLDELMKRIHYARSDHESIHKAGDLVHLRRDAMGRVLEKKEVAHLVEEAVMDNTIEINFQPIFSFESGKITSLEVLARLKDREKRYINPEFFIHVAEENHTIIQLGKQIYEKACIFAEKNHIFDYGVEDMNINLSPAQCRYERLTEELVEIATEHGIPMSKMHLEITESEFTDTGAVSRTLNRLKKSGAKVALDDFGTGNSTLVNILELPVDFVKIDKSLVWSFAEGKNQFLNKLMPMIKAEGKKIIAEGIETEEHIDIIKKLNGDYLQGYYFSKPLPEDEFMRYLKKFNGQNNVKY